ncbi:MAG: DUF2200 family protein [Ruthenibacterium lactatiformans]
MVQAAGRLATAVPACYHKERTRRPCPGPRKKGACRYGGAPHFQSPFFRYLPALRTEGVAQGRTQDEVDAVILWLTGYTPGGLVRALRSERIWRPFFGQAPRFNPAGAEIKGVVCGVRVEDIEDPLMQKIRYLDKLIDELAKGRPMEKYCAAQRTVGSNAEFRDPFGGKHCRAHGAHAGQPAG